MWSIVQVLHNMNSTKTAENEFQEVATSFPGITDEDTLLYLQAHEHARQYKTYLENIKREQEDWKNRHRIPLGLTKKELTTLQKETQKEIDRWKDMIRKAPNETTIGFCQAVFEDWIAKKKKIIGQLKFHEGFGEVNIAKAKQYPIEQLIEFDSGGFARCLNHEDRTPSMKWYKARNKVHCFSCSGDFDSIDIYMKINNVSLIEAVKKLT